MASSVARITVAAKALGSSRRAAGAQRSTSRAARASTSSPYFTGISVSRLNWRISSESSATRALTSPADRNVPVTPPAWLGKRPPVVSE